MLVASCFGCGCSARLDDKLQRNLLQAQLWPHASLRLPGLLSVTQNALRQDDGCQLTWAHRPCRGGGGSRSVVSHLAFTLTLQAMLTLRQQLRGLVLLAEAAQRHSAASVACSVPPGRPWQLQALAGMHSSRSLEAQPLAGITQWLAQRMPASLGGIKDGELDIESELEFSCLSDPFLKVSHVATQAELNVQLLHLQRARGCFSACLTTTPFFRASRRPLCCTCLQPLPAASLRRGGWAA